MTLSDWTTNAHIAAYLKAQHPGMSLNHAAEAEAYGAFMQKLQAVAAKYNRTIIHWEDVFDWAWAPEFEGRKWVPKVRNWPRQNGVFGFC